MAEGAAPAWRTAARKSGEWVLKALGLFVILEPIWMLLPFAGFLYGSALHIHSLSRNQATSWLTHFVFPVLTLGPLGPSMAALGLLLFVVGAAQIYTAKIRRSGIVTRGLYRYVRHPQYVSLTLFGLGILLTWGRRITFIAFFAMMVLYYFLAKSEERNCRRLFGEAYEKYRERTSFIFPGDRFLRGLGSAIERLGVPAPLRGLAFVAVSGAVCACLILGIGAAKESLRSVPFLEASVPLPMAEAAAGEQPAPAVGGVSGGVPYVKEGRIVVARGPCPNGAAPGFAERVLQRLRASETLGDYLSFLDEPQGDSAIVFCLPFDPTTSPGGPGRAPGNGDGMRRGPPPDPSGPDRVRLMIMRCSVASGAAIEDSLEDTSRRKVKRACIAPVNTARPAVDDMVEGRPIWPGPGFPAEEQWGRIVGQFAERPGSRPPVAAASAPGAHAEARLILVQAPILKTRLQPQFAREILDRLAGSVRFREQLGKSGAGGDIIAVAFPRPGENWYSEHDRLPKVSVFVVLARLKRPGAALADLFRPGERDLLGAFTAEIDFRIDPPAESVSEGENIGPRRDLEERWEFFLSGV